MKSEEHSIITKTESIKYKIVRALLCAAGRHEAWERINSWNGMLDPVHMDLNSDMHDDVHCAVCKHCRTLYVWTTEEQRMSDNDPKYRVSDTVQETAVKQKVPRFIQLIKGIGPVYVSSSLIALADDGSVWVYCYQRSGDGWKPLSLDRLPV